MILREVPVEDLQTGDRVLSYRGRHGKILMMRDIGVTTHTYLIVWSIDGEWASDKQLVSIGDGVHYRELEEYPVSPREIKYLGRD